MKATVSSKGQVTIPKNVRDRLGLRPGTRLDLTADNGRLIGTKIESSEDPVAAVTGIVSGIDVDAYLEETRGPAE